MQSHCEASLGDKHLFLEPAVFRTIIFYTKGIALVKLVKLLERTEVLAKISELGKEKLQGKMQKNKKFTLLGKKRLLVHLDFWS